ncbi:Energy-coupling factor transporter ATP-binding protein EcfA3 [bioreactor metagenome]|uniref:Energy-coupling factor transporter ATP-binding protein EcfA3 n=1 Tax=bioreactor metagenome TaxID=1076179 RepID=A0A644X7D9_9ZZZZ
MRNEVLSANDLVHTYKGGVTALKGVNLRVFENEIVSIVGQNGSGKTTLVRHFNGLLRPTSGNVFLYGEPTEKRTVSQMSRTVGYVFQNPNHQIFSATVREELAVAPKNFKTPQAEYEEAIERVVELMHIQSILDVNPLTLDYTTKKIVTIASVLVFHPKVLILDEPTGGLDEAGRIMLSEITQLVHDEGHTVIMISHDMDYVAEHSERIVVMAGGEIIGDGLPEEIFSQHDVMERAQIEPPQIAQLDSWLDPMAQSSTLSVEAFVKKYGANSAQMQ